jgi:hypothetical protein
MVFAVNSMASLAWFAAVAILLGKLAHFLNSNYYFLACLRSLKVIASVLEAPVYRVSIRFQIGTAK